MSHTLQKLTKLLLVFILVATPLRATWADGATAGEIMLPNDGSAALQMHEYETSMCCCSGDDCAMQSCDQCDTFTSVVLVFKVRFLQTRHRIVSTPYLKAFDNRQLRPLLQPPRA